MCIGVALFLEPNDPQLEELTHELYISVDLSRHFRGHLSPLSDDGWPQCEVCDLDLACKINL